ncbi:DUF1045 domain-containing protein [Stappia indica]|uniref:DUF1045 domain-containing protein n=1 Tax=Stappia indica TaxID=538381 RepID=UPI001CD20F43|nr:DUF1045 domain-containing protein [Stappia indica]MCA1299374.1 DUF1045 domain-containing protein [Stappia indica]
MRYALYFTPPAEHPLVLRAEEWLGRSAFGRNVTPLEIGGLTPAARTERVTEPARYGFHGTLKAPFRLAEGTSEADLIAALDDFAAKTPRLPLSLRLSALDGFLALTPAGDAAALNGFAGAVVRGFDRFRARMTPAERARRRPERLDAVQLRHLDDWGYPYVFEAFRFHMTLTGRLDAPATEETLAALRMHFAQALAADLVIDHLALFRESEPGAPFTCLHLAPLTGAVRPIPA